MEKLIIGKSFIEDNGDRVRLCAIVKTNESVRKYYFEVNQCYKKYLCLDRADPFVTALINFSQVKGYDIICKLPVTKRLLYQLQNYYLPIVYKANKDRMQPISIIADGISEEYNCAGKVVASASGGVDSFYTIVKHLAVPEHDKYRLTHIFVTNYFNTYVNEDDYRNRFNELKKRITRIADAYKLDLYDVYTNMYDFRHPDWVGLSSMKYASCLLACNRLFSIVYAPSSYEVINLTFKYIESLHYDLFNMKMLCTDKISFFTSGGECTRLEKLEFIADDPVVQKELLVCNFENHNCSVCDKCLRTEYGLHLIDRLNEFSNVFDLNAFESRKRRYLIKMLRRRTEYDNEIINLMKKKSIRIPIFTRISAMLLEPINWIKKLVTKNKFVDRLYYDTFIYKLYNGEKVSELTKGNR